jgi:hypothetical protein
MTADSQLAVQSAVLAALQGAPALTALLADGAGGVYDSVPAESAYPYVVIGEATAVPGEADSKDADVMEQTLTLHTWSRYLGLAEAKQIMAAVVAALDQANLSISGHSLVLLRFEFSSTFLDPDGLTRHGVQRFRVITQQVV